MKILSFLTLSCFLLFNCTSPKKKASSGVIEITDGWVRPTKAGKMSAAYFKLKNETATTDTLLRISSDVTSTTQIHESFETDDGLMGMREQKFVALPKGETIAFKQGGLHVMIIQPDLDLVEGDSVTLTLQFSSSKDLEISLPIKASGN
ncbi:MAG: copper chaperone PCu(A)C [Balneolaceae bacterium]|nr:copper chaperone PCu(A)C [Balneolaceae bacterium]MBO6545852.1 copper chaperone PCu(A)C [Balneolaceae bacterium]MBO6647248.1 copper chaperone PCu(A)C [Balneolaceae bacterium]